jgi:uncharacterized protein YycO
VPIEDKGSSVPLDSIEPGDILLTRSKANTLKSKVFGKTLEAFQGTPFVHAALYAGNGQVIHARMGDGVVKLPMKKFNDMYDYRAYRVRTSYEDKLKAVETARENLGKTFNTKGLLKAIVPGFLQMADTKSEREAAKELPGFICSSLISAAYPHIHFGGRAVTATRPVDLAKSSVTKLVAKTAESRTLGVYEGKPSSPDTVKFKTDFQGIPVNIDRPKGFTMLGTDAKGKSWRRTYLYDYGSIPKTQGGDSEHLDVFIGPNKKSPNAFWVVQKKDDGNFDEYKVMLGFDTRAEALSAYKAHVPAKYFSSMLSMTVEMMRAMLGQNPEQDVKVAALSSMCAELLKLALVERLVRLGATDVPKTPRLLMRHRSPQDLSGLQSAVEHGWDKRVTQPLLGVAEHGLKHLPSKVQPTARKLTKLVAEDPVGSLASNLVPLPGAHPAYLASKKGLERIIDRVAPLPQGV